MKVKAQRITDFMSGRNTHFMIPVYQRPYDWIVNEQCQVLWDDLQNIIEQGMSKPHFFGSIVRVVDSETGDWIIIDGQQRLTTVSLLLLAIAHKAAELEGLGDVSLPDKHEVLSLCMDYRKTQKLKLKLLRKDKEAYECIGTKKQCIEYEKSKVIQAYRHFYINLHAENIMNVYEAIKCLEIVDIMLGQDDDNPQLVFESLNSKGLDLNDADKIRNFILIGLDYAEQEHLYSNYWEKMEENVRLVGTSEYIWNFLTYKTNKPIARRNVYFAFKKYSENVGAAELIKEIYDCSGIYHDIITKNIQDKDTGIKYPEINTKLEILQDDLKQSSVIPLLMDVFDRFYKKQLREEDVLEFLTVLESYQVRRSVVGNNKSTFLMLNTKIESILKEYPNALYADVFKYLLDSERGNNRMPSDEEVEYALKKRSLSSNKGLCKLVLSSIEKIHNPHADLSHLRIEQIMPQDLSDEWKSDLGNAWEQIYSGYVNSLGNLTMVGYDSMYSNRTYRFKKRIPGGFDDDSLYINSFMKDLDVWNQDGIDIRAEYMIRDFLKLWPIHKSHNSYPLQQDITGYPLNDNNLINMIIGRKPTSIYLDFIDKELNVVSWKDLYYQVINSLYESDEFKARMQDAFRYCQGNFYGIISKVEESKAANGQKLWDQIIPDNSVWFHVAKSAPDFIAALKVWFEYLNISQCGTIVKLK